VWPEKKKEKNKNQCPPIHTDSRDTAATDSSSKNKPCRRTREREVRERGRERGPSSWYGHGSRVPGDWSPKPQYIFGINLG